MSKTDPTIDRRCAGDGMRTMPGQGCYKNAFLCIVLDLAASLTQDETTLQHCPRQCGIKRVMNEQVGIDDSSNAWQLRTCWLAAGADTSRSF